MAFTGELIAKASSSDNRAMGSSWSGETGRWQGERDTIEAIICEDQKQIIEFIGYGWLAKELYEEAAIDAALDLDEGVQS